MSVQVKTMEQLKDSRLLYEKKIPAFGYMLVSAVICFLSAVVIWSIQTPKNDIITSDGMVQSVNKNYIMSPFTGEISEVCMKEGSNVEEGEALFTVKSADLDFQGEQLEGQKKIYETQILQYQKLVKSIQDDTNYFDSVSPDDSLYFSQYETYKSQIAQQTIDTSTLRAYGYTEEQIEAELVKNQSKVTELYYAAIKTAEASIQECQIQLDSLQAQLNAVGSGQKAYTVTANATGKLHVLSDYKDGMVVQAATALASVADEQDEYIIQTYVSTVDVPRIKVGDPVDIVVSGLIQSVYGMVHGTVESVDSDASVSQSQDGSGSNTYFKVQVRPDITYLVSKNGNKINLSNGMEVQTRIKYDEVTYFDYVLDALGILTR